MKNQTKILILLLIAMTLSAPVMAQEEPATESDPVLTEEETAGAEEDTLVLDTIDVTSEGFTFEQEVTMRLVRAAYHRKRSQKWEDRDELICWIQENTGTHFKYLKCARNGDIWALRPDQGMLAMSTGMGGYGKIMVSDRPVNKYKIEQSMNSLPGNNALDDEFVDMVLAGETPPRDIPDDEEIGEFITAYRAIGELDATGGSEDEVVAAIEDSGLTVDRYNRIVDLLEVFATLKNDIGARLKATN